MKTEKKINDNNQLDLPKMDQSSTQKEKSDDSPFFVILGIFKYRFPKDATENFQLRIVKMSLFFVLVLVLLVIVFKKEDFALFAWGVNKIKGIIWTRLLQFLKGRSP